MFCGKKDVTTVFSLPDICLFNNVTHCPHLNLIPGAVSLLITSLSCTVLLLKVCVSSFGVSL